MTASDTVIAVDSDNTAQAVGCHAGEEVMRDAAAKAGKDAQLEQYDKDYPKGPHDQPQSMCPAFGSLRVGLRMRRTATVLSGSACRVYGLTFTSHFYGAKRTVGYVPFDSESLVTGKLFEDIREAVHELANPDEYDAGFFRVQRLMRAAQRTLGTPLAKFFLCEPGHHNGQFMWGQCIGVVQHRRHRQVLTSHRPVDYDLQPFDGRKHIHRAPVAAGTIMIEDQHQLAPPIPCRAMI